MLALCQVLLCCCHSMLSHCMVTLGCVIGKLLALHHWSAFDFACMHRSSDLTQQIHLN